MRLNNYFFLGILLIFVCNLQNIAAQPLMDYKNAGAEEDFSSIRHEQQGFYEEMSHQVATEEATEDFQLLSNWIYKFAPRRGAYCKLDKEVYGYHPSWLGSKYYKKYDFSLLSTFSYFSYELNPRTGGYKTIHSWRTSKSIDLAQESGCRIELCVTNFGAKNNMRFLGNKVAWKRLTTNLIELLAFRNADGVNIDFENVPKKYSKRLSAFMQYLSSELKRARPGSTVTMAIPAVNWNNVFELNVLGRYVDKFIIMGYDYHYSRSRQAGPVSPLKGNLSISSTINAYVNTGVSPKKFILAVPYYGREWRTKSSNVPSNTMSYVKAPTYKQIKNTYYKNYARRWDYVSATPYFVRGSGRDIKQCWYDSKESLAVKYDLVNEHCLGGVGMWALGYDDGYDDLWNLLENKFLNCKEESQQQRKKQQAKPSNGRRVEIYSKAVDSWKDLFFKNSGRK